MLRAFEFQGHICMSLEILGSDLKSVIDAKEDQFTDTQIADVGLQLYHALEYVHSLGILHTDIKTDNVLIYQNSSIQDNSPLAVKLVDFGSANPEKEWHPPLIGTPEYRAPEAVLQAGYTFPVDVWGVACILIEMVLGQILFKVTREDEHLVLYETILGQKLPQSLLDRGLANQNQWNRHLLVRGADRRAKLAPSSASRAQQISALAQAAPRIAELGLPDDFLALLLGEEPVGGVFTIDPKQRLTAAQAKNHRFFHRSMFFPLKLGSHGNLIATTDNDSESKRTPAEAAVVDSGEQSKEATPETSTPEMSDDEISASSAAASEEETAENEGMPPKRKNASDRNLAKELMEEVEPDAAEMTDRVDTRDEALMDKAFGASWRLKSQISRKGSLAMLKLSEDALTSASTQDAPTKTWLQNRGMRLSWRIAQTIDKYNTLPGCQDRVPSPILSENASEGTSSGVSSGYNGPVSGNDASARRAGLQSVSGASLPDSDEASSFTDSFKIGSLSTEKSFSGSFSLLNNRASTAGTAAESTNEAGKHDVELKEDAGGLVAPPPSGDSTAAYEQGLSRRSLQRKNSEERIAQRLESLVYALPPYAPYPGACCDAAITSH